MLGKEAFTCKRGIHDDTEHPGTDGLYALEFIDTQTVGMMHPFRIIASYLIQIHKSLSSTKKDIGVPHRRVSES